MEVPSLYSFGGEHQDLRTNGPRIHHQCKEPVQRRRRRRRRLIQSIYS